MKLLETRRGATMSEPEIRPWPSQGMSTTGDLLSARDLTPVPPTGRSVGQVLAAHGALQDNWDGEGAVAPASTAIRVAEQFVAGLPADATPSISASVEGGVLLEWESQTVGLILEIGNTGSVEAFVSRATGSEVEGSLATVKQHVLDALADLLDPG